MQNQLQRAINLAKKTGDKLIIYDMTKTDCSYVVMSLDQYECMALGRNEVRGLTEDKLIDKINQDIAIWKSNQNQDIGFDENSDFFINQKDKNTRNNFSQINKTIEEKKNLWGIPKKRKQAAEEIIEEDRQCLEKVD